ncbi:MAG: BREX system Lon protease-like protein BrxL [Armatimonadota bacterium]|nr:BREX system Lon protease-like protein BrxL [Armatimonadota bacterium]
MVAETVTEEPGTPLARKIREVLGPVVIDKCRLPASKLRERGVPGYVAEWVLDYVVPGEGPLTPEEARKVQEWAAAHIPKADESNVVRDRLLRGEMVKVLTPLEVEVVVTRQKQDRAGRLSFLEIKDAKVREDLTEKYPELLKGGMWGRADLFGTDDGVIVADFRPMQAQVDLDLWKEARCQFTLQEWRSLLILSMGYEPGAYSEAAQMWLLCRLLPLVQKNLCMMELAPKGTGKSYIYQNISPKVRVVSGGNVTPAVLFVNNSTGQPGILARFALVVLDEVQKLKFEHPEEVVGTLKGFLANGVIGRGGKYEMSSDCSLMLLANIELDEEMRPVSKLLSRELPDFLQETAFLDRISGIIPGWEIPKLTSASLTQSVGLKTDFFGNILLALRDDLLADHACERRIRCAGPDDLERNSKPVRALASGLMKLLFPHGQCSDEEFYRYCVRPAVRMRQLVWDELYTLDPEFRRFGRELRYGVVLPNELPEGESLYIGDGADALPEPAEEAPAPDTPTAPPVPPSASAPADPVAQVLSSVAEHLPNYARSIAEARQLSDPGSALVKTRKAVEGLLRLYFKQRLGEDPGGRSFFDLAKELEAAGLLPDQVRSRIHWVRKLGNIGAHSGESPPTSYDVEEGVLAAARIGEWFGDSVKEEA